MTSKTNSSKGWAGASGGRDATTGKFSHSGNVNVVRTVTMPNGSPIRVVRKDAFDKALAGSGKHERKR